MNIKLLLLEHDEDDLYITKAGFVELGSAVELETVKSSNELIGHLDRCIKMNFDLPDIILLNYSTVSTSVLELIAELKSSTFFAHIPIVVGCGVVNEQIVAACYAKGASSFIRKASNIAELHRSINTFVNYWSHCAWLPGQSR